jgi:hypothetical protein
MKPKFEYLDYYKMLREIDNLVETDFVFDMDCQSIHPEQEFTQEEATKMRDILMQIYSIAHCIDCTACQTKYFSSKKDIIK